MQICREYRQKNCTIGTVKLKSNDIFTSVKQLNERAPEKRYITNSSGAQKIYTKIASSYLPRNNCMYSIPQKGGECHSASNFITLQY
jgi:hypothetical protein